MHNGFWAGNLLVEEEMNLIDQPSLKPRSPRAFGSEREIEHHLAHGYAQGFRPKVQLRISVKLPHLSRLIHTLSSVPS